jgi:hypothetical protein
MIRIPATGAPTLNKPAVQVLGDYLLLWIGGPAVGGYSAHKVYLIPW